jgi:hypothetical protein
MQIQRSNQTNRRIYMSRLQRSVLSAFAVVALLAAGAIGASTASAAFTLTTVKCVEGLPTFCYEKTATELDELEGEEPISGVKEAATASLLEVELSGAKVKIECKAAAATGTALQLQPLIVAAKIHGLVLKFTECALIEPTTCKVPATLTTKNLEANFGNEDPVSKVTFKPVLEAEKEIFIQIAFENNGEQVCPATIKGTKNVTGTAGCTVLEPATDTSVKLVVCNIAKLGSTLLVAEQPAAFQLTEEIKPAALTDKWSIELA